MTGDHQDTLRFIEERAASYGACRKSALTAIALDRAAEALAAQAERIAAADHTRTCYARALDQARIAMFTVVDGMEDEGDRVYFGSTNHADILKDAAQEADALKWDEILDHTQPSTSIAETNFKLQEALAAKDARIAELEAVTSELVEKLDEIFSHPSYQSVWVISQSRVGPYDGPKCEVELNSARAALENRNG